MSVSTPAQIEKMNELHRHRCPYCGKCKLLAVPDDAYAIMLDGLTRILMTWLNVSHSSLKVSDRLSRFLSSLSRRIAMFTARVCD